MASGAGHTKAVNGMEMYYETHGRGEPLVLLHGFTGSSGDWAPFIDDLAKEYQIVAVDMRGHGRSTNPSLTFTHRQSALDVFGLLDQLDIQSFKAIGMSAGAKTLLHMATQQPARADALVLVSASPYFPKEARAMMHQFTTETLSEAEWQVLRGRHQHGDDQIRALFKQGSGFGDSYDDMNFTPPYLSTITARTLIVHGDRDLFYPAEIALQMYRAIPRSYLWMVPNGVHGPIYGPMMRPFIETATAFLRGEWEPKQ